MLPQSFHSQLSRLFRVFLFIKLLSNNVCHFLPKLKLMNMLKKKSGMRLGQSCWWLWSAKIYESLFTYEFKIKHTPIDQFIKMGPKVESFKAICFYWKFFGSSILAIHVFQTFEDLQICQKLFLCWCAKNGHFNLNDHHFPK